MRSYQKTCEVCVVDFLTTHPAQRTCGQTCGYKLRGAGTSAAAAKRRTAPEPAAEPEVRFVPLTKGRFAKVDEVDFADVSKWNWSCWTDHGNRAYAARGQIVLMHRYIMRAEPGEQVDHKNGDGLDNRRRNLRKATVTENSRNHMKRRGEHTSKYKGVSWHCGKWCANISRDGKAFRLGRFTTEEEAALAYDEAARRLHGEFARVNFPIDDERPALH